MSQSSKQVHASGLSRNEKSHARRKIRHDAAQKRKLESGVPTDGFQEKKADTKRGEARGAPQNGAKGAPSSVKGNSAKGSSAKGKSSSAKGSAAKSSSDSGAGTADGKSRNKSKGSLKAQGATAVPVGAKKLATADSSVAVMKPVVGPDAVTLFVGNLPFATSTEDIRLIFDNDAGVQHVRMVQRANKTGKGFGFVLVRNQADAERLLKLKNGTVIEGRPITVQVSADQGSRSEAGASSNADNDGDDGPAKSQATETKSKRGKAVAGAGAVSEEQKLSRRQYKLLKAQQKEAEVSSGPAARDMAAGTVLGKRFKGKQIKLGGDEAEADADGDAAAQPPAKKAKKQPAPQLKQKPAAKKAAAPAAESDDESDDQPRQKLRQR